MAKVICRFCGENTNTAQSVPINRIGLDTVSEYCNDCTVCKKNVMCNSCLDAHEMRSCENAGYCPVCERSNGWVCRYCGDLTSSPQVRAGTQYCDNCVKAHENRACETAGHCEICDTDDGWVCHYCGDLASSPQVRAGTQYCGNSCPDE